MRNPEQPRIAAEHPTPTPLLKNTLNLLLVGVDGRLGTSRGRPDTILLLSVSEDSGHVGIVSIPRDLYVDIPGHGQDRINATYSVAIRERKAPAELLRRVVEDTLMLPIAHTISIDLDGFERSIDAIGGIDVEVPCPIADNFIDRREASGRRLLEVDPGLVHMDGVTALMYARSRHGRSDWSRARRQQAVLVAIKRRLSSLDGIAQIPHWFDELQGMITTEMTRRDMLRLARYAVGLKPARLHGVVLGHRETKTHRTDEGKAVLLPEPEAIAKRLEQLFSADLPGVLPSAASCPAKDVALRHRSKPTSPPATAAQVDATAELVAEALE